MVFLRTADSILVEATESSLYDIYERLNQDSGNPDDMIDEIVKIRSTTIEEELAMAHYGESFDNLIVMVKEKIMSEGLYEQYFPKEDSDDEAVEFQITYCW